jgi:hypothetical protein
MVMFAALHANGDCDTSFIIIKGAALPAVVGGVTLSEAAKNKIATSPKVYEEAFDTIQDLWKGWAGELCSSERQMSASFSKVKESLTNVQQQHGVGMQLALESIKDLANKASQYKCSAHTHCSQKAAWLMEKVCDGKDLEFLSQDWAGSKPVANVGDASWDKAEESKAAQYFGSPPPDHGAA